MSILRTRILVAALALLIVLGSAVLISANASSLKKEQTALAPYAERYGATVRAINANAGSYRERDYYSAASTEISTPANGQILINPVQLPHNELSVPGVEQSTYTINNSLALPLYTRISNSKRTEERSEEMPAVATLSLDFVNTVEDTTWQSLNLYTVANNEELVNSALLFAPAPLSRSTNWRTNASLYLTDGGLTNHAAALLPGVNIVNTTDEAGHATGVIYTNRPLAIGSLPAKKQDEAALQALEASYRQSALQNVESLRRDVSQSILGTDLIFTSPEGKRVTSSIQAPASASGASNTLTVEGGVIVVEPGATLVIGSGELGGQESYLDGSRPSTRSSTAAGTIDLKPRAIIVDGGTLVLSDTDSGGIMLTTSIQVRGGGMLKIGENVTINGNIYAFGGGAVEAHGSFTLNGTPVALARGARINAASSSADLAASATEYVPGGIFIFADTSLQADGTSLGRGYFYTKRLWLIDGSDGINPNLMSRTVHFLSTEGSLGYPLMYNEYRCYGVSDESNICAHFGSAEGTEAAEIQLGMSKDNTLIEVFVSKR